MVGRAALVCGPPLAGACCVGACPPAWWGVLYRCVPPPPPLRGVLRWFLVPLVVERAVLVRGPPFGRACRVGAGPPRWRCVVMGVVICWMGCGRDCVVGLAGVGVVLVRAPSPVGACRVCACPPPWWGVLRRRVRVSVRGVVAGRMPGWFCWFAIVAAAVRPALSGVGCVLCLTGWGWCCAGACPLPCLGVPCLCVAPPLVGRAMLVCGPPLLGRAVLVASCRGGGVWFGLSPAVGWIVVAVVLLAWPGLVPCLCVAPPLVGSAVSACSDVGSWCCSRLDARLVLLVRCCLRRRTAGVVGCWLSVVFAWPGLVLCWCVPRPLVGHDVLVCGPPHGGACCVGTCPPSCSGVLCWCPPAAVVVFGLSCRCPLGGLWLRFSCWLGRGWCCAGACPPPLLGRAVFVRGRPLVGRAVSACSVLVRGVAAGWMLGLFCWFAVVSAAVRPALSGVCCLWCLRGRGWCCVGACPPPCCGVPCLCVAPQLVGRAVSACSSFGSWCYSWLDAPLVLLVRCCLRRRTAGVVGCLLPVACVWPGLVLCWCVPPPLLGRAVLVCGPRVCGACCVGVFGFRFVVL